MLSFTIRRLLLAVPVLLVISLVIFLLLDLAPGDPLNQVPLTVPPEVRRQMRAALGADAPMAVRYLMWLKQFFVIEPLHVLGQLIGRDLLGDAPRILSWQSRAPVADVIAQRLPQTLMVIGSAYVLGVLIALPVGIYAACHPAGWFDQISTALAMIGFSVPTFFSGVLLILLFSVGLGWFPSVYDTTLRVTDWQSFGAQLRQMAMPVAVLALYNAAEISRYMRAAMLDTLGQDYVRTARAKGLSEQAVVLKHVLRNAMIPVVTVIAMGVPGIFGGAIITEQVFGVNGLGQLLISAMQAHDLPMVQTLTFLFAVLIVLFNLVADLLYGLLDPRIRYD
ncbi:ABC transporter permease [Gemmobacter fulvus]|uniref:ABC transporter permease n=1 Tax=Gemmobacter fulvus TaxID=2840474 RepID=A0A975P779_9RHOB|nr:ABC transporter permease [Gemmobacter fulvus]MBT9245248.1 ABC transporter permease [Gemmobacter fulvus]QWK90423.1 ABC transporter permease [Gemmobacter fulvus]